MSVVQVVMVQLVINKAMYYKVTYNTPKKKYKVIETGVAAESKYHAMERVFARNSADYPDRSLYKAKKLKDGTE